MQEIRLTIRISLKDNNIIDMFLRSGEFATKSEFVRRAIREYSMNHMEELIKNAKAMQKLQEIVNSIEQIEEYTKK